MNIFDKAVLLVEATQNELAMGTKHYDKEGNLLTEPRKILEALRDNNLIIEPTPERRRLFKDMG